jgi:CBS domain-containing protein
MTRTDTHLDAMLRHLGAAYYESLHGRAARSDVARALDTVEEHLGEQGPAQAARRPGPVHRDDGLRRRRWARRVSDVMTTTVTVDRITPYQEIDRLLTRHRISGVPVLKMGREVVGVVSETDLLAAEDETRRQARMASSIGRRWHLRKQPHVRLTAGALMTAPDHHRPDRRQAVHHPPLRPGPVRPGYDVFARAADTSALKVVLTRGSEQR